MKQKQHNKREYQTDLRIKGATPHQVAQALVRGGAPKQTAKLPEKYKTA